jgi:hypothetical protein
MLARPAAVKLIRPESLGKQRNGERQHDYATLRARAGDRDAHVAAFDHATILGSPRTVFSTT